MRTCAEKPKASRRATSSTARARARSHFGHSHEANSILYVQRTIGNHVVQRLFKKDGEESNAGLTGSASPPFGHDFSRLPITGGPIPTKLDINKPGDEYEHEAERVAEQVMRMPEPQLQHACPCGGACPKCQGTLCRTLTIGASNDLLEQEDDRVADHVMVAHTQSDASDVPPRIQRFTEHATRRLDSAPDSVDQFLASPGTQLEPALRLGMEQRFGHDFSRIRVHTDAQAAESARAVSADAYTVGRHIVFGVGQFAPATLEGRQLIAHELTHVLQGSRASSSLRIQRKVSRCCREVRTGNPILDIPASAFDYQHCWLKTDAKAVGMGPAAAGPLPSWPFGTDTKLTDHSGETPTTCKEIPAVDENRVNRALVIGTPTGKWSTANNCNTLAEEIINACMDTVRLTGDAEIRGAIRWMDAATIGQILTTEKIRIINRLLDGWVSDDDIKAIGKVYRNTPADQLPEVRKALERRLLDLTDIGQRTQVRVILAGG